MRADSHECAAPPFQPLLNHAHLCLNPDSQREEFALLCKRRSRRETQEARAARDRGMAQRVARDQERDEQWRYQAAEAQADALAIAVLPLPLPPRQYSRSASAPLPRPPGTVATTRSGTVADVAVASWVARHVACRTTPSTAEALADAEGGTKSHRPPRLVAPPHCRSLQDEASPPPVSSNGSPVARAAGEDAKPAETKPDSPNAVEECPLW